MKSSIFTFALVSFCLAAMNCFAAPGSGRSGSEGLGVSVSDTAALLGRWDLTVNMDGRPVPSWFEVIKSGTRMLVGRFVGGGGSARPVSRYYFVDGKLSFSIPPQWEREDHDLSVEGHFQGDSLVGTMVVPNGKQYTWSGRRAPSLQRMAEPVWGEPVAIFDGKTLTGWHTPGANQWVADNGVLRSPHSGSNIISDGRYSDFKLHIEFRYPKESNSGVYLRGRYEVQIEDMEGQEPPNDVISGVYGFLPPSVQAVKGPGEWQTYDITLVGRLVTVVFNGKTVICNAEIPGITGGAIDSREGEPGPIYLQGDHGPIEFRNIMITPAK
ncbi:MAG TPA: DUF1080 domain-containing protein [Puia sp.]|jgi:hypothetical protein|nr:DUF1080 domain-containing protein [Puia sp.]